MAIIFLGKIWMNISLMGSIFPFFGSPSVSLIALKNIALSFLKATLLSSLSSVYVVSINEELPYII